MNNTHPPQQDISPETRWLFRGIGLAIGIALVLTFKVFGTVAGAAIALAFMVALLISSRTL